MAGILRHWSETISGVGEGGSIEGGGALSKVSGGDQNDYWGAGGLLKK